MIECQSNVLNLIEIYNEKGDIQTLKKMIEIALLEELQPIEYIELYKIGNLSLRKIVVTS